MQGHGRTKTNANNNKTQHRGFSQFTDGNPSFPRFTVDRIGWIPSGRGRITKYIPACQVPESRRVICTVPFVRPDHFWLVHEQNCVSGPGSKCPESSRRLQNPKKYGHIIIVTSISALSFVTHSSGTRLRQIVFHLDLASDKDYTLRISLPHCDFSGISVLLISTKFNPRSRSLLFGLGMLPWALCNLDWSSFD